MPSIFCEDCNEEVFVDVNMVMVRDEIWKNDMKMDPDGVLCDVCMEKRLGRPIAIKDLKPSSYPGMYTPLANHHWIQNQLLNLKPETDESTSDSSRPPVKTKSRKRLS